MLVKADSAPSVQAQKSPIYAIVMVAVATAIIVVSFSEALLELVRRWSVQDEYSHGFLIPVIAAWLVWSRRDAVAASLGQPSWTGPALIVLAGLMLVVGKLSSLFILAQLGFIVALFGVVLGLGGYALFKVLFIPIIFLIFAIPTPYFLDAVLSYRLQLISSDLGVFFIRLAQIPVYLEGNVIDLGAYKLQVVEACSGLRYLYPLMSLGFLAAYLFRAPLWQRALVFLSTIPITIFMNSFRIGVVGVMVNNFGPQDADGALHMFEGWIIFIACAGVLIAEMFLLSKLTTGKGFFDVFAPPKVVVTPPTDQAQRRFTLAPLMGCLVLVAAVGLAGFIVSGRQEIHPERRSFAAFPNTLKDWQGRPASLERDVEAGLGLTDYVLADYVKADRRPVNLYVAYYASQRTGLSPHSPSVCIPGNGWQISSIERTEYHSGDNNLSLPINRVLIARGSDKQLVYYWFEQRGLKIANEYWSKFFLLRDAILTNRTDGALVRLTTPIFPGELEADADKRLQEFLQTVVPALAGYLPAAPDAPAMKPAMTSSEINRS